MLDDNGRRWLGLCCVPGVYLCVDRRYGFGFVDELTHFRVVWLSGKQRQYRLAGRQSFPGLSEYSAFRTT